MHPDPAAAQHTTVNGAGDGQLIIIICLDACGGVGRFSGSPILNFVNCIIAEGRGGVFAGDGQF